MTDVNDMIFEEFPKMARLSREMIITEKIDGTNAQILITDAGDIKVGSRTKWITPGKTTDNYGFARWVEGNKDEVLKLGPGRHFGEWWGNGIGRGYGLKEKRFSLFNVVRWGNDEIRPQSMSIVPVLYEGKFDTSVADAILNTLTYNGSSVAPGFDNPEGIVVWHTAANIGFKKTVYKDELPKSLAK